MADTQTDENNVKKAEQNTLNEDALHKLYHEADIPTAIVEKLTAPTISLHNDTIIGLQTKISELIGKDKRFKSKLVELEDEAKTKDHTIATLEEKLNAIQKDYDEQLNSKETHVDVDEIVEKRTKSLRDEHSRVAQADEDKIRDLMLKLDEQITINRNQLLDYEITKVESDVGIPDFARPDFRNRMKDVFKWDKEEERHVARTDLGEPIFNPINPSETVNFKSYAERVLKNEAPHLFTQYFNPTLGGNTSQNEDLNKFFDRRGKPNLAGMQYKKEHGAEKYEALRSKFMKSKKG